MSVVAGVVKAAAGAKMLTGARPAKKALPRIKRTLVVGAVAMFVLAAIAALILASDTPNAENSSAATTHSQSVTEAPVSEPGAAPQMNEVEAFDAYEKLPFSFIPNEGQTDKSVRYYAQGAGYGFFFTTEGAMLSFSEGKGGAKGRGHALALEFHEANSDATLTAQKRLSGKVNYLVGDDPTQWQQELPTHAELRYGGLWPGIDMAVHGDGSNLKYEFHLKPGASVDDVRLGYRGAKGLSLGAGGELLIQTSLGVLKDAAPVSYQRIGGKRVPVESRYVLKGDSEGYGFWVGSYDPRYPLIIDPGLDYSTFLGGTGARPRGIAVRDGRAYMTGATSSTDFPTTPGAFDTTFKGVFVTKLNASGSALAYSTFLGGSNFDDGEDIAVDGQGRAYVTGETTSPDFPTSPGAFDTALNPLDGGFDAFVTKLNGSGSELVYSTFLGGTDVDSGDGIAVRDGRAYVTGMTGSDDYPTTPGAFDTTHNVDTTSTHFGDVFVTKLNVSGSALAYSTFLGGTAFDRGTDITVDRIGSAYVTGHTNSSQYPTTPGAFDTTFNGHGFSADAFVTKFNASGSTLTYSTFLGRGRIDEASGIAVDGQGKAYVTGHTNSSQYPTTSGAFDTTFNGDPTGRNFDAFVTKLNASGSAPAYSTFLGGTSREFGEGIAVDGQGRAYVTGLTESAAYPTTPGAFDTSFEGFSEAFVTKLNDSGSAPAYSTFLGGSDFDEGTDIAVDGQGRAYVTGVTSSADYPTSPGAFDTTFNASEAFVTKLPTG